MVLLACTLTAKISLNGRMEQPRTTSAGIKEVLYLRTHIRFRDFDRHLYVYIETLHVITEPNNYFELEGCVVMYSGSGHWNDAYCGRPTNGYACKRPADGKIPSTPKPTQIPEGHCPQDHYEFKGYCYNLVSVPKNWTEAANDCQ